MTKLPVGRESDQCQGLVQWDVCYVQGWNAARAGAMAREGCLEEVTSLLEIAVTPEEVQVERRALCPEASVC